MIKSIRNPKNVSILPVFTMEKCKKCNKHGRPSKKCFTCEAIICQKCEKKIDRLPYFVLTEKGKRLFYFHNVATCGKECFIFAKFYKDTLNRGILDEWKLCKERIAKETLKRMEIEKKKLL